MLAWFFNTKIGKAVAITAAFLSIIAATAFKSFYSGKASAKQYYKDKEYDYLKKYAESDSAVDVMSDSARRSELRKWSKH